MWLHATSGEQAETAAAEVMGGDGVPAAPAKKAPAAGKKKKAGKKAAGKTKGKGLGGKKAPGGRKARKAQSGGGSAGPSISSEVTRMAKEGMDSAAIQKALQKAFPDSKSTDAAAVSWYLWNARRHGLLPKAERKPKAPKKAAASKKK